MDSGVKLCKWNPSKSWRSEKTSQRTWNRVAKWKSKWKWNSLYFVTTQPLSSLMWAFISSRLQTLLWQLLETTSRNCLHFLLAKMREKQISPLKTQAECWQHQQQQPVQPNQTVLQCDLATVPPPGFPITPDSSSWFTSLF